MKLNNKTNLLLLACISSLIWISGCTKPSTSTNNNTNTTYRVKTITYHGTSNDRTDTLVYDNQGRLTKMGTMTYSYGVNHVTENNQGLTDQIALNSNGYISTDSESNYGTNYNIHFTYGGDTLYAFWVYGGVASELDTLIYSGGDLIYADYLNNGANGYTYLSTTDTRDYGTSFFYNWNGILHSKHLINAETNAPHGSGTWFAHAYTYDQQGRVATETIGSMVRTYTYY